MSYDLEFTPELNRALGVDCDVTLTRLSRRCVCGSKAAQPHTMIVDIQTYDENDPTKEPHLRTQLVKLHLCRQCAGDRQKMKTLDRVTDEVDEAFRAWTIGGAWV